MIYSNSDRPLSRLHFENKTFSNNSLVLLDQIRHWILSTVLGTFVLFYLKIGVLKYIFAVQVHVRCA